MFQRLIAIPQEEYMQLKSVQQVRQPLTQQFQQLQRRYHDGENIAEPYKRMVTQSEILDEMQDLKVKMRQGITNATPKAYQTRAKTLFQNLEPFLKFNERGEIYNKDNQLIAHSRLEDLVQHAVRDRRRNLTPTGWPDFRQLLQEHNVPKFMLNRDTLDEMSKEVTKKPSRLPIPIPIPKVVKREPIKREPKTSPEKKERGRPPTRGVTTRSRKPNPKYGKEYGFLQKY